MKSLLFILVLFELFASNKKLQAQSQSPPFQLTIHFNNGDYSVCMGSPKFVFAYNIVSSSQTVLLEWYLNDVLVDSFTKDFEDHTTPARYFSRDSLKAGDSIYCILTGGFGYTNFKLKSNTIVMHDGSVPPPEVHIDVASTTVCSGSVVTFSPIIGGYGRIISYIWTVNGDVVQQGARLPKFVSDSVKDGSVIGLRWIVSVCGGGTAYDDAEPITMRVKHQLDASIKVSTPFATVCENSVTTFTAKAEDGGPNPDYIWRINGNRVGTNSTTFSTNTLREGDEVSCLLLTDTATYCTIQPADTIKIHVVKSPPATIAITASGTTVCEGSPVTFTALTTNEGFGASYNWVVNGVQTSDTTKTFNPKKLKDKDSVWCVLKTKNACSASPEITSNTVPIQVNPLPRIAMLSKDTTVLAGTVMQLQARILANTRSSKWLPEAYLISPQSSTTFTRPLTTGTINFLFAAISEAGCTTESRVNVIVKQPLYMPNAFTPNGDGTNDVFRILPGSDIDLEEFVVFDRWGNKVFQTKDPARGWNGRYKNVILSGTYVYLITGKNSSKKQVTIKGTVILIL